MYFNAKKTATIMSMGHWDWAMGKRRERKDGYQRPQRTDGVSVMSYSGAFRRSRSGYGKLCAAFACVYLFSPSNQFSDATPLAPLSK